MIMGNLQAKRYNLKISKYDDWANSLERTSILGEIVKLEKWLTYSKMTSAQLRDEFANNPPIK